MNKNLLTVIVMIVFIILISTFTSIQGRSRTYEVQPQIKLQDDRTDAGRAIDAYERLMERYMDLVEKSIKDINVDIENVTKKLDSIDKKLTNLSAKTLRIEKALGIERPIIPSIDMQEESSKHQLELKGQK